MPKNGTVSVFTQNSLCAQAALVVCQYLRLVVVVASPPQSLPSSSLAANATPPNQNENEL